MSGWDHGLVGSLGVRVGPWRRRPWVSCKAEGERRRPRVRRGGSLGRAWGEPRSGPEKSLGGRPGGKA